MTLNEIQTCDTIASTVMMYRQGHDFVRSPCWMDEWALGYFCALRDLGILNNEQWEFLCNAFQPTDIAPGGS